MTEGDLNGGTNQGQIDEWIVQMRVSGRVYTAVD